MIAQADIEAHADLIAIGDGGSPSGNTARIYAKDVELLEQAGESLMRSGDVANTVVVFSLALRWRMAITEQEDSRDRRERIPQGHRGAWAEGVATTFLIEHGFEVYRNTSPSGPVDLIALMPTGETILVDVKTCRPYQLKDGSQRLPLPNLSPRQIELGVRHLLVYPNGKCEWRSRES